MYYNFEYDYFEYFSEATSKDMAAHMERLFEKIKRSETAEED